MYLNFLLQNVIYTKGLHKKIISWHSKSRQTSHKEAFMKKNSRENFWQIQEAKAQFSQLVEDANTKGYQTITKQGEPVAVILSKKEFDKMSRPKMSLLNFFKNAPCQEVDLSFERSKDLPREIDL